MRKAAFRKYQLVFRNPVLTSRGEMKVKNGYLLFVSENGKTGTGECSFIEGLSVDDLTCYETVLQNLCTQIEMGSKEPSDLSSHPSIKFGLECAMLDLQNGGNKILFESNFTKGTKQIAINGLIWMGRKDFMLQQIEQKLEAGFHCLKLKVGAIDFEEEVSILKFIRQKFPKDVIELRLDANGAFTQNQVFKKLEQLSRFSIHSIEQPVKVGQYNLMKEICSSSPIPVALDEELILLKEDEHNKDEFLQFIQPAYVILKPSMLGGFKSCNQWIKIAEQLGVGWWATSALESNIGLNAIAQWVATKQNLLVQGLGTGELYINNISSPLFTQNGKLGFSSESVWGSDFSSKL